MSTINALPGEVFVGQVTNATSAVTIGCAIYDPLNNVYPTIRFTAGIRETPSNSGIYYASLVAPTVEGRYQIIWDEPGPVYTSDDLIVSYSALPNSDLTTLTAVKAFLKKTDTNDDVELQALITAASSVITTYCRREFTPDAGNPVTHRFRSDSRIIDFRNLDLQSASTVTLNPQSTSPQVLTEWTGYELLPLDGDERLGTYTYLKLFRHCWRGHFIVDIEGAWGAASVPSEVAKACDVTVAEWFRSKVTAYSTQFNNEGVHVVPAPLPTMVCGWLEPYRRVVPFL